MVLRFFFLAGIFLFTSCHDLGERDNPDDPGGINYQGGSQLPSSSSKPSSSSYVVPSSSSVPIQTGIIYGDPVPYEGETYETVKIGSQTWFKRNLNYAAPGSKCGDEDSKLKDENTSYCDTYGRLYDWATAMALPSNCNYTYCYYKINTKHRGICPDGWHIPSNVEWSTLWNFVDWSETKLKANSNLWSTNTGTDIYGFAALPGGGGVEVYIHDVGNYGSWWSAKEYDSEHAWYQDMGMYEENNEYVYDYYYYLSKGYYLFSVRCLKD